MLYVCKGLVISVISRGNINIISGGISNGITLGIRLLMTKEPMRTRTPAMLGVCV